MSRFRLLSVVATALTVGVLGFTLIPAHSASGTTQRFRVCDQNKPGYEHDVDTGESGFSAGDQFLFADKLLDTSTGRKAGRDVGDGTVIRVIHHQDAVLHVSAMFYFPKGKISVLVAGRFSQLDRGERFPVTGGTGAYENATGSVFIKNHPCDGEGGTTFHFHLTH